ncbi:MAG: beta-lactamase family protein, partial [Chloroflexi bacterium]|nr:beta-lactamase family protein [Chloroflexota bacterium]
GDQILQGSTLREMQRIHWLNVGWQEGWGLGFSINRRGDKTYIGHGGALLGYRTLIQLLPSEKVGVIVLTNADDGNPLFYLEKAFEWIVAAVLEAVKWEEVTVVADPAWQQYLGLYRNVWSDTQIMLHKQQLIAIDPSLPDPMPFLTRLIPISEHTFRMETKFGGSGPGELAIFHLGESGNVARLQTGENFRERIEKW